MKINFECGKCKNLFDCDVGEVTLPGNSLRPHFEKNIICPTCGIRTMDEVFLTELGQSQLTRATLEIEGIDLIDIENIDFVDIDNEDDELSDDGFYEGDCQGCDSFESLNVDGLCRECSAKLDRDLIRERDWAYSVSAYGVPESKREELRNEVIKQYGEKLELIAPSKNTPKKSKKRKRKKKKSGKK
jgi:rubredoxin